MQNLTQDEPKSTIQNTKMTVIATLVASLIGGLFGFSGSLLVFFSSERSLQEAYGQHVDDVQREIYVNFVTDASKLRNSLISSSDRAIAAGRTLSNDDCKIADLDTAKDASVVRVYLISPVAVNNAAYLLGKALDDWAVSVCSPGSRYAQEMKTSSLASFDSALDVFRITAKTTLTK